MAGIPTELLYSSNESECLGLRIGRCNTDYADASALRQQILEGSYDVCRLKVACNDEAINHKLDSMGFLHYFSGSIRRYITPIKERPTGDYIHRGLEFEYYDGSQEQLLFDMIEGTWGDYPIGYYRTPYLSGLITKQRETECLFQFYKKANNPNLNPDNNMVFIREGDHYVGFFALNHVDGHLESHVGGILKPWRNGGYFLDMQRYIKNYCIDNNLSAFWFGARNENSRVQQIFQSEGYIPVGTENVYHVLPLLQYGHHEIQVTKSQEFPINPRPALERAVSAQWTKERGGPTGIPGFSWRLDVEMTATCCVTLGKPLSGQSDTIRAIGIRVQDGTDKTIGHGYARLPEHSPI